MRVLTISKINEQDQIHEKWKENLGARYEVSWKNPKLRNLPTSLQPNLTLKVDDYG